jgi:adenylylsulfate kinase
MLSPSPLLIAMAGLPGSGKSTLARRLAHLLPAVVIDKDRLRAALFPPDEIDYSARQDDLCFEAMLQAAAYLLKKGRKVPLAVHPRSLGVQRVILDGRTFSKAYQVERLHQFAGACHIRLEIIECRCSDEIAAAHLARSSSTHSHPAGNRDFALYQQLKAQAVPITLPHLVIDTSQGVEQCVARCLEHLHGFTF